MNVNKLIAEFMGHEIIYRPYSNGFIELSETQICDVDDLLYHCSWDWLMPVVRKCGDIRQEIREGNIPTDVEDYWDEILEGLEDADIEYTYKSVREFILWYNQKQ